MLLTNDICVYEQFIERIVHKYNYECVYTDVSKCPVINSVSSAVFVACAGELYSWKLDPRHSVLGSELYSLIVIVYTEKKIKNIILFVPSYLYINEKYYEEILTSL